ncbi:uncharacterized protein TNIN_35051 [Trichonephila inaurata madagascariensis]|uniref:Uncharacterized protein n=1 Tax=Trichonephila inaurata madagascariensis TaxID=2747483 RepID=A0A8X6Y0A3_9ARAC|nr:uncharacterized protein TNIN_35051 [Trichonephila inaurata madagascariensis]
MAISTVAGSVNSITFLNRATPLCLFVVFILSSLSYAANVTLTFEEEYVTSEEGTNPSFKFSKAIIKALRWRFDKDSFMAPCTVEKDCDIEIGLICKTGRCVCKPGDLLFQWPKYGCFTKVHMFGQCEVSQQCVAMNSHTYCNPDSGRCTCSPNYFYNGRECSIRYDGANLKAQEVYKAAVVAAACFIVAIVGIFVACIVRRRDHHLQQSAANRESDIFSISDEIAALRAVDKPPSYEEVLQIERTFYGIPPPEYAPTPRIISSLSAFEPRSNCTNGLQLPYSSNYLPSNANQNSGDISSSREYLKNANQGSEGVVGNLDNPPALEATVATNFLASAEVLSPPSVPREDVQITIPSSESISIIPSQRIQSQYISSTPPPPRLHRSDFHLTSTGSSSSLPGSPNLSSIKVLNLSNPLRKELTTQNSLPSELPSTSHIFSETSSQVTLSDIPSNSSEPQTRALAANCDNADSKLAYDNLGFVSE